MPFFILFLHFIHFIFSFIFENDCWLLAREGENVVNQAAHLMARNKKRKRGQNCRILFEDMSAIKGPSIRLQVLRFSPLPNNTTLGWTFFKWNLKYHLISKLQQIYNFWGAFDWKSLNCEIISVRVFTEAIRVNKIFIEHCFCFVLITVLSTY